MLVLQIDQNIIIALIGVLGGVLPVGITYVITKRKEINANDGTKMMVKGTSIMKKFIFTNFINESYAII